MNKDSESDSQIDWCEDVVDEPNRDEQNIYRFDQETSKNHKQKPRKKKPKRKSKKVPTSTESQENDAPVSVWANPSALLADSANFNKIAIDDSIQIRSLLSRAVRWNIFSSNRGVMLPNEDAELWTVLKKLLQDAFEHDGQTVCLFEINMQLSCSKVQILAKLAPCPDETEKSNWFNPAKFAS